MRTRTRGHETHPKVYQNGPKTVLGIWFDLEWKFWFSKPFFYVKNQLNLSKFSFFFLIMECKSRRTTFFIEILLITVIFKRTLLLKMGSFFDL